MGLLGDYLPDWLPDDTNKADATRMGLLALGATMMGAKTGNFFSALGQGVGAGVKTYGDDMEQQSRQTLRDVQKKTAGLDLQTKQIALDKQKRLEDAYRTFYAKNRGLPTNPAVPSLLGSTPSGSTNGLLADSTTQPADSTFTPASPVPALDNPAFPRQPMPAWMPQSSPALPRVGQAPSIQAPSAPAASPADVQAVSAAAANYARHLQFAQYLEQNGLAEEAQKYYDLAEKFKPKINSQKTLIQDGKPVNVLTYDDGRQEVSKFGALPEIQFLDVGGKQVAADKNVTQNGQEWKKTLTPGEVQTGQLGWANYGLSKQKFGFEQAQAAKPTYHDGFWVTPPTAQNPTGTVIAPASNSKERDANDVLSLLKQAEPLLDASTGSYAGVAADKTAQFFGAATPGAKASAQLGVIGGALVSKMPKMSGPQSDKDVALYKEMAGKIGDPTVPAELKRAAMQTITEINQRYATGNGGMPDSGQGKAPAPASIPSAAVQMLKTNPTLYRAQFDKKYGKGASASILGK